MRISHLYFVRSNSIFRVRLTERVVSLRGFFRGSFGNYSRFPEIIRHLPLRVKCGCLQSCTVGCQKGIIIVASYYSWPENARGVARLVAIYVV